MSIPRPEHPRPQFVREQWLNLNGEWQFEVDAGDSGRERGLHESELSDKITVPFCPESELSGVFNRDFLNAVWYRRTVTVPADWKNQHVLLHFQAVDYDATVWVNGREVGRHRGGFSPFSFNLRELAKAGEEITIVVRARDSHLPPQPRGKQSQEFGNHGCLYTRTTGIWQTVWIEAVPASYLQRPRLTPDVSKGVIHLDQSIANPRPGLQLRATLSDDKGEVVSATDTLGADMAAHLDLSIAEDRRRLWSLSDPHLYDLKIELLGESGEVLDSAQSYAGLRGVSIEGQAIKLNGEIIFQRLVLDQGYYPDGIMTAPSDEALVRDIELSLEAGFNGARLHQKVFEERFLYHADRMGYMCWGEFPDWGCRVQQQPSDNRQIHGITFAGQWIECIERDYSHPCIVGWCPLNETHENLTDRINSLDDATHAMYWITKVADPTRPVLDASGYSHRVYETDVYDCHDYEQDPAKFHENQKGLADGEPFTNTGGGRRPWSTKYNGQPYFVSEFGGIWWNPKAGEEDSWGYGERPKTLEEFYERFEGLCAVLLDDPHMFGYCYTQLTDVYQEQNGIYDFDREEKFEMERIRRAQQRPAAIEAKQD